MPGVIIPHCYSKLRGDRQDKDCLQTNNGLFTDDRQFLLWQEKKANMKLNEQKTNIKRKKQAKEPQGKNKKIFRHLLINIIKTYNKNGK